MKPLPHTHSCFVCGDSNPSGLNVRFETDGQAVYSTFRPRKEHVGFSQTVHGGITSTMLDEIMVWACAVETKKFAYCAELNVRFLLPIRPDTDVRAKGWLISNRRNKIFEAGGELSLPDGTVVATSTGKYLPIGETLTAAMIADFVGDAEEFLRFGTTQ
jgi:acyl-coenzyme A thioesterase PaaI-like protein